MQLLQDLTLNAGTQKALAIRIERRKATLGTGAWDKDLILSHMTGHCMVFGMCYTPGMEWDSKTDMKNVRLVPLLPRGGELTKNLHEPRVQDPADEVVDELGV